MALTPEMYNQLRGLQKKAKDLRQEVRNLRRMSQAQAHTIRETILDTFITIRYNMPAITWKSVFDTVRFSPREKRREDVKLMLKYYFK